MANGYNGQDSFNVLLRNNGAIGFSVSQATGALINFGAMIPNDNKWHDILFTWTGDASVDGAKIYVDDMTNPANKTTSTGLEVTTSTRNFILGNYPDLQTGQFFNGQLDQIEIYDRVISLSQTNISSNITHNTNTMMALLGNQQHQQKKTLSNMV